jgi:hypothetical protein
MPPGWRAGQGLPIFGRILGIGRQIVSFRTIAKPTTPDLHHAAAPRFVTDESGRVLFYPIGASYGGYVVPDAECERVLREAADRYHGFAQCFGILSVPFLGLPALIGFYSLVDDHLIVANDLLVAVILVVVAISWVVRRAMIGRLTGTLEPVGPSAQPAQRIARWLLAGLLAYPAIAGTGLYFYHLRLAALPGNDAGTVFYSDVSFPLFLTYLSGGFVAMGVAASPEGRARVGEIRLGLANVMFGAFAVIGFFWTVILYLDPTPALILTPTEFVCGRHRVPWQEIAAMRMGMAGRYGKAVILALDSRATLPALGAATSSKRSLACEITSLDVEHGTVYDQIAESWEAHRTGPRP